MPRSSRVDGGGTATATRPEVSAEELQQAQERQAQRVAEALENVQEQALADADLARVQARAEMDQALAAATAKQRRQVTDEARLAQEEAAALAAYQDRMGMSLREVDPEVAEAYDKIVAAKERAANRSLEEFQADVSDAQREAVSAKFWRGYAYVGTSIEDAIANDPEIASDPRITRLGASQRGIRVPDFHIQGANSMVYAIDITGGSKTSVREHRNREYLEGTRLYANEDQIITYRTRTVAELHDIFAEGD